MLIIIYSETNQSNILENLGKPEYSYYFVLKEFRPVLERLGRVVEVTRPDDEIDQLYADCLARGEDCVFLSFSPSSHRCPLRLPDNCGVRLGIQHHSHRKLAGRAAA